MSLPATRHRRTGSLTTTASEASLAGVAVRPGRGCRARPPSSARSPQSHAMALKAVTWATEHVGSRASCSTGCSLPHGVLGGRVVLEVDGGQVGAHPPAGPPLDEVDLVGPLQHDDVDLLVAQLLRA